MNKQSLPYNILVQIKNTLVCCFSMHYRIWTKKIMSATVKFQAPGLGKGVESFYICVNLTKL